MKTPIQLADKWASYMFTDAKRAIELAIREDRAQRSDMERFGEFVYDLMDGSEWSSDTLQAIGDYAASVLGRPFSI